MESSRLFAIISSLQADTMANQDSSPTFDALCEALQRNDPNTTSVEVIWDRERDHRVFCPLGYGPRLGEALRNNTFVETIELQLAFMLDLFWDETTRRYSSNLQYGDLVISFLRHSTSLRTIKLWTSGSIYGGRMGFEEETLVRNAVMAVAENPHGPIKLVLDSVDVKEGSYPVDVPPDTLVGALKVAKSMEELTIWLGDGGTPGCFFGDEYDNDYYNDRSYGGLPEAKAAARTAVASAFGDNCSLKRLTISGESDARSIQALVQGLRRNGSLLSIDFNGYNTLSPTQEAKVQKYCARNQGVADLLAKLSNGSSSGTKDSQAGIEGVSNDDNDNTATSCDRHQMIPGLFAVVLHSPRLAFTRVLQGLQTLPEEMKPGSDKKRAATSN